MEQRNGEARIPGKGERGFTSWLLSGRNWPWLLLSMLIAYVPDGLSLLVTYARNISWCSGRKSEHNGKLIVIY